MCLSTKYTAKCTLLSLLLFSLQYCCEHPRGLMAGWLLVAHTFTDYMGVPEEQQRKTSDSFLLPSPTATILSPLLRPKLITAYMYIGYRPPPLRSSRSKHFDELLFSRLRRVVACGFPLTTCIYLNLKHKLTAAHVQLYDPQAAKIELTQCRQAGRPGEMYTAVVY